MKKVFIVAVIIVVAIIIGIFVINIYEADTEVTKETTKVGVILNGSIDDRSWSQSHYEGLEATAQELNLSIIYQFSNWTFRRYDGIVLCYKEVQHYATYKNKTETDVKNQKKRPYHRD